MRPCPPIQDALRRGNPPLSLHRTPPRPSGDPRKHAGTLSRRPPYSNFARMCKVAAKAPFSLTRVAGASVTIAGNVNGRIGRGFLVLLGVGPNDTEETADRLAEKICNLRVFEDENGKMNLNLEQTGGALLVVSQFTLYADTSSRRPGFTGAAKPDAAIPLYERFMAHCRERGFDVQHGEFGADMQVDSRNDGPVTILFDTERPL